MAASEAGQGQKGCFNWSSCIAICQHFHLLYDMLYYYCHTTDNLLHRKLLRSFNGELLIALQTPLHLLESKVVV